jgi:rhodanese-related sulfurtransferase
MASSQGEKVDIEEARRQIASGEAVAVDARSEEEFSEAHVPGAIHIPDGDVDAAKKRPDEGARVMVIAEDGKAAAEAAGSLSEAGYEAVAVDGDMKEWVSEDFQIQPTPDPDEDTELGSSAVTP